jgi:hypothetical protein
MESLGNECLATVGPTHDPDASVQLSLNECIQLVVSRLEMYHTNVLMYRTMVLLAHPTKVRR